MKSAGTQKLQCRQQAPHHNHSRGTARLPRLWHLLMVALLLRLLRQPHLRLRLPQQCLALEICVFLQGNYPCTASVPRCAPFARKKGHAKEVPDAGQTRAYLSRSLKKSEIGGHAETSMSSTSTTSQSQPRHCASAPLMAPPYRCASSAPGASALSSAGVPQM